MPKNKHPQVMTELNIQMLGNKACKVNHHACKTEIVTSTAPEYGGTLNEFSSTDLLAAALGTCIATTIDDILLRNGIPLENVEIIVTKELSVLPKQIKFILVKIVIKQDVTDKLIHIIGKAAKTCMVHNSLSIKPEIKVEKAI